MAVNGTEIPIGARVTVGIRPEWIQFRTAPESTPNEFTGTIEGRTFLGDAVVNVVRVNNTRLIIKTSLLDLPSSGSVVIKLPSERCIIFNEYPARVDAGRGS
jgi:hypothetical protein